MENKLKTLLQKRKKKRVSIFKKQARGFDIGYNIKQKGEQTNFN